jgi:transposase
LLELWKRLELDRFFEEAVDDESADVPWSRVAALLAINRLCAPGSELAIEQRWYPSTALDDLLQIEDGKINDTRLYRCLDRILPHKTKLERHLKNRYGELFGAEFDVLLYDLTSTYVEGAAEKNPMVRRGYSRDHRPDCEQLVIALTVNNEGFPFSYETFDGNRTDVSTMETILRMVERKYGKARRIWAFDRGIVSEENLGAIRKRGGQYLTGTPRSQMKQFEAELLKEDWTQVRPEVEVRKVAIPQGEETYILCRTSGRKEKEKAIRHRFSNKMETALKGLEKTIAAGRLKDRNKMERRLGKIQARHPQVNDLYDVELKDTAEGVRLFWQIKEDRRTWRESREGAYLLRTNLKAETAEELWAKYMQLTEAEASFRALKSELSIRPLFHQLEPHVKAHVMAAFLGYALWVTLKHLLKRRPAILPKPSASGAESAQPITPMKAIALLSTLQSADIVLPTTDGREIRLRRVTEPTAEQKLLLRQLGIMLPEHLQLHRECSADSDIA